MAPVDMALMESGSDNQSEQQSSSRMSRMVAVLVVSGLIGSAFLLGRGSVTASVSQSVELLPGSCARLATYNANPGGVPLGAALVGAPTATQLNNIMAWAAANTVDNWQLCQDAQACGGATGATVMARAECQIGQTTCPGGAPPPNTPNTPTLHERFLALLNTSPGDVKAVCDQFRNSCASAVGRATIDAFPRCKGLSPCQGGSKPVCIAGSNAPDLGEQFSCMTAGKPEIQMMSICAEFKAACTNPADQAWLNGRPRCNAKIPRHDGSLDDIHENYR